jgi:DNA-binding protein
MTTTENSDNIVFVGNKPFMNYATGVAMQFNKGASIVIVKARGKFISKCVDVAEVARRKFLSDKKISVQNVSIGSEEFENKEGKMVNVSVIEIELHKE